MSLTQRGKGLSECVDQLEEPSHDRTRTFETIDLIVREHFHLVLIDDTRQSIKYLSLHVEKDERNKQKKTLSYNERKNR